MNDKELAEMARKIVGEVFDDWEFDAQFVRDWRVAGALMEKCHQFRIDIYWYCLFGFKVRVGDSYVDNPGNPAELPRAIIEACVAALDSGGA